MADFWTGGLVSCFFFREGGRTMWTWLRLTSITVFMGLTVSHVFPSWRFL